MYFENYLKTLKKCDNHLGKLDKEYPELGLLKDNEFEITFALTKAEFSELTKEEARYIYYNYKDTTLSSKEFFDTIKKETDIQKQHDKLEYFNILKTIRYINKDNKGIYKKIKNEGITRELLIELHLMLTDSLDELFLGKSVKHYSPYLQGEIRTKDNIKVGGKSVGPAREINNVLEDINKRSLNIINIEDIFTIHQDMYRAHFFSNGNKRICRCIEIILNNIYGFVKHIPFSVGNYFNNDLYLEVLFNRCIKNLDRKLFLENCYSYLLLVYLDKSHNFLLKKMKENGFYGEKLIYSGMTDSIIPENKKYYISQGYLTNFISSQVWELQGDKYIKNFNKHIFLYKEAFDIIFSVNYLLIKEKKYINIGLYYFNKKLNKYAEIDNKREIPKNLQHLSKLYK